MKTKTKKINSKKYFANLSQRRKRTPVNISPLFLRSFKIAKDEPVKFVIFDNESLYTKINWCEAF